MRKGESKLAGYRDLPTLAGMGHILISFFGRLPTSMIVIGVLTFVAAERDVTDASIASAALAIATGVGSPLIGRWTDRAGQRPPLLILSPLNAAALVALVAATTAGAHIAAICAIAALIGLTTSPVGALTRVRWYPLAKLPKQLASALSWESMADEMAFVLGPAAVGILASAFGASAPLLITAALVVTCVIPFALSVHAPGPNRTSGTGSAPGIRTILAATAVSMAAMAGLGLYFGSMQTSTTAFAQALGRPGDAGLIYAAMGLGSAITALGAVALPAAFTNTARIIVGGLGIAAGAAACTFATSGLSLAALLFVSGLAIGPASVAIFTLAGERAPEGGDTVAMTAIGSFNVMGVAASSAIAGRLLPLNIDYGFLAGATAGLIMAAGTTIAALALRRRR